MQRSHWLAKTSVGDAQGGSAPLAGGAGCIVAASVFCWRATCPPAWGEPARPGLPPEGETGKGEIKNLPRRRRLINLGG
jgi:hypothetical protein